MFGEIWPYTNLHDLNLDWILEEVRKLHKRVDELTKQVNSFTNELEECRKQMVDLINSTDAKNRAWTIQLLEEKIKNLENEITKDIATIVQLLSTAITNGDANIKAWVSVELQKMYNLLPRYQETHVINPVSGLQDTLQNTLNDLFSWLRYGGPTALEYAMAQLTADEYAALDITAKQYALYGKWILRRNRRNHNLWHVMPNPWTGEWAPISLVVNELAALHRVNGPTAAEYEAYNLTAHQYLDYYITATEYAWDGKNILGE